MTENPYESPAAVDEDPRDAAGPVCPDCGRAMAAGYLPSFSGIHWRDEPHRFGLLYSGNALPGTQRSFWELGVNNIPAYRCSECEIVVFRLGKAR